MTNLQNLVELYAHYFLNVDYRPTQRPQTFCDQVVISRQGEDWDLYIEENGDHFYCRLSERYAGTLMCEFCFRDEISPARDFERATGSDRPHG